MSKDALDELIVDEREAIDVSLLASIVKDFLRFTKEGEIIFEKKFYELKDWKKILVYLLGRKVIVVKKLKQNFKEVESYKEISKLLGIKEASVRKYVSLELKGIIKSEKGNCCIPNFNLYNCEEVLKKK